MQQREITKKKQRIYDLLSVNRLKEALSILGELVKTNGQNQFILEQEQLDTTYRFMLQYTVDGIQDPERQKVYRKLVADTYELTDQVTALLMQQIPGQYIQIRQRVYQDDPGLEDFLQDLLNGKETLQMDSPQYLHNLTRVFNAFWLTDRFGEREQQLANVIRESEHFGVTVRSVLVTSLLFSLLRYFDTSKFDLLFAFYELEDTEISNRALIGLLLAFYQYDERLIHYPALRGRLLIQDELPDFNKRVKESILQFIRSKDTEQLTRKMQSEILPEMIKLSPQVRKRLDLDKLLSDSLSDDQNPEWDELLGDTPGLKDKMLELSEMQMEGDDVFMSSFAALKGFPFFQHLVNWFMPFSPDHPELKRFEEQWTHEEVDRNQFLNSVNNSFYLCNSDKYSICFGIQTMPTDMQKFLSDGLKAEADQMEEILSDEALVDNMQQSRRVIRQYTQDLYRFFKLHPDRHEFSDLFSWKMDFFRKGFFQDLFKGDSQVLHELSGFYLQKNNYKEAADVYEVLLRSGDKTAEVLQKAAFAHQKMGDYDRALTYYLQADILVPESIWNLKKIGLCYRYLKQPEKALQYYRQAELQDPEDLNTEVSIGHCLLDVQEYEEALRSYFKVEYLAPENHKVWRPIAWCSFILGKFDQARKYYNKLMEEDTNRFDLINLGHLEWCEGHRAKALERYRESISRSETTMEEFIEIFVSDREHLIRHGVDPEDIPIMLDQLRYILDEA